MVLLFAIASEIFLLEKKRCQVTVNIDAINICQWYMKFAKVQSQTSLGIAASYILDINNFVQLFLMTLIAENSEYLAI